MTAWRSQYADAMAAVLLLVLLPLIASVGFMFGAVSGDLSAGSVVGGVAFLLLAGFLFYSAFELSKGWDQEDA